MSPPPAPRACGAAATRHRGPVWPPARLAKGTRSLRVGRPLLCTISCVTPAGQGEPSGGPPGVRGAGWGPEQQQGVSPGLGDQGADGPSSRCVLTRTRGPWSLAPAEVSTSSPGQMTRRALGQRGETVWSRREERASPSDCDLPAATQAADVLVAGPALTRGCRPSPSRLQVGCGGPTRAIPAPEPAHGTQR